MITAVRISSILVFVRFFSIVVTVGLYGALSAVVGLVVFRQF